MNKRLLSCILAFIAVFGLLFFADTLQRYTDLLQLSRLAREKRTLDRVLPHGKQLIKSKLHSNKTEAELSSTTLPKIFLRAPKEPWERFKKSCDSRLAGALRSIVTRRIQGEILVDGRYWPCSLRTRGLCDNHYHRQAPSLRVNIAGNVRLKGMKRIDLLEPFDKGLREEVIFSEARASGLTTLLSEYVLVFLNGKMLGLYQLWLREGRELTIRYGKSEGLFLTSNAKDAEKMSSRKGLFKNITERYLKLWKKERPSPEFSELSSLFDIDKLSLALAFNELVRGDHGWLDGNFRAFFDPARGKIEPVLWDWLCRPVNSPKDDHWGLYLLKNESLKELCYRKLYKLCQSASGRMANNYEKRYKALSRAFSLHNKLIGKEKQLPSPKSFRQLIENNGRVWKERLEKNQIVAKLYRSNEQVDLELTIDSYAPIRIDSISTSNSNHLVKGPWGPFPARKSYRLALWQKIEDGPPEEVIHGSLQATNLITGKSFTITFQQAQFGKTSTTALLPKPRTAKKLLLHRFKGPINNRKGQLLFGPGKVSLQRSIVLPKELSVTFLPGLDLHLLDGARLVIEGELESRGTIAEPIKLNCQEGSILVMGSSGKKATCVFQNTSVHGGLDGYWQNFDFTSALALCDVDLTMDNCTFAAITAEDGLNVDYSKVQIRNCTFKNCLSDGLDLDFCQGRVSKSTFTSIGGDGLDLSGSQVLIDNCDFSFCKDKALSIGEGSKVTVNGVNINDCAHAFAVKDGSFAELSHTVAHRVQTAIAAYVKKPSYGPSKTIIGNSFQSDCDVIHLSGDCKVTGSIKKIAPLPKPRESFFIAHTNDRHGVLLPPAKPEKGPWLGGVDVEATVIDELRKKMKKEGKSCLFVDCGDLWARGDKLARKTGGRAVLQWLDKAKYDYCTFGNWDLCADSTIAILKECLPNISPKYISTNWHVAELENLYAPYVIHTLGKSRVVILGVTTIERVNVDSYSTKVRFEPAQVALNKTINDLSQKGLKIFVLLSHMGSYADEKLARNIEKLDLIVGGHSHTRMNRSKKVGDCWLVQAGSHGRYLGLTELFVGTDGDISDVKSKLIPVCRETLTPSAWGQEFLQ